MKIAVIGVLAVLGSGCALPIEIDGFDDVQCRPAQGGSSCMTTIHISVEASSEVYVSVDSPWGSNTFDTDVEQGSNARFVTFSWGDDCEEGDAELYGYVQLKQADDDWDSETVTVHIRCVDEWS